MYYILVFLHPEGLREHKELGPQWVTQVMHHGDLERKEGCDVQQIFVIVGVTTSYITLHQNCLFTIRLLKHFPYRHFLCSCLALRMS